MADITTTSIDTTGPVPTPAALTPMPTPQAAKLAALNGRPLPTPAHAYRSGWMLRRRMVVVSLVFIAGWLSFVLWRGADNELNRTALYMLGGAGVTIMGQYVFGKSWDDRNFMAFASQARFPETPPACADAKS